MTKTWSGPTIAMLILAPSALLLGCGRDGSHTAATAVPGSGRVIPAGDLPDGLTVTFASRPDPPAEGDNTFDVTVTGPDGTPITDATVTLVFSMPAMPSMNMPAMRSETTLAHTANGRYEGSGDLTMGGTWNVAVTIARGPDELTTRRLSIVAKE